MVLTLVPYLMVKYSYFRAVGYEVVSNITHKKLKYISKNFIG